MSYIALAVEAAPRGASRRLAVRQALFFAVVVVLWQLLSGPVIDPMFVSNPVDVARQLHEWTMDGTLARAAWETLWVSVLSFAIGTAAGIVIGYVFASWSGLGDLLRPAMTALYTLPKLVLAPLFILWFGIGFEFRVVFASFIVFFFVYYNTYSGVREVPDDLVKAVRLMGATRTQLALRVIAPSALVWVANGLKISLPYAFTGVIVAEMLAGGKGLGHLLRTSSDQFFAAGTFAALVVILVLALVIDAIVSHVTARALSWKGAGTDSSGGD
ncbi:MAG: ABC transporter permease [Burkholderiaceae bacterium]|nr:ABC transporter permease [Burkholderiaceae bacterium]